MMDQQSMPSGLMQGFPPPPDRQVTLANWRQPPFSRWAFQNVRQIIPTAGIWRGPGSAAAFEQDRRPIEHLAFQGPDGEDWTIGRMLAATDTDGFLVLRSGRLVAESYANGLRPETPHILFSVSKSVTGTLAGVLVGRGQLDPDAPVTLYIPEAEGSAYGDCAVRHVLDMTVGVDFAEDYLAPSGTFVRYRIATAWNPVEDPAQATDLRRFLVSIPRDGNPHGTKFHYVSPNADLLGWILERAGGAPYAALLGEALWQPMGAEFDAYVTVDRLGAPRAAGGLCMTLGDLGRFGELMRRRGAANGRQLVPDSWVDDIFANGDPAAWRHSDMARFLPNGRYRSQWYNPGNERDALFAVGIHGQWIYIDRAAEVVIAKFSSQPLPVHEPTDHLLLTGFDALARAVERM